jgi:hypothetical protein
MMDEFLALGRMQEVEKAYGLMAGYNLIMWPFVQDFGRLKDLYGKSVNAFITNSRAVQVFGVFDEETTEFISKNIGDRTLKTFGTRERPQSVKFRAPNEVALDISADSGRQYILRAGKTPLLLEKVEYYNSAALFGMWKVFPDHMYDNDPEYPAPTGAHKTKSSIGWKWSLPKPKIAIQNPLPLMALGVVLFIAGFLISEAVHTPQPQPVEKTQGPQSYSSQWISEMSPATIYLKTSQSIPLRKTPSKSGQIVHNVPLKAIINIIEPAPDIRIIDGHIGFWCKVRYQDQVGYIFYGI